MALTTIKTGGLADNSVTDAKVADAITVTGAQTGITQVGTLTAGTWNGTAIASAYLDADTAHLSTTQTFSGAKTFSTYIQLNPSSSTSSYLQFATGGTTYGYVGSESSIVSGGTAADMTIGASGDTNLTLTTNGAVRATLNSSGTTFTGSGDFVRANSNASNANCAFALSNETTLKWSMYNNASNNSWNLYDHAGSANSITVTTGGNATFAGVVLGANGSASAPSFSFSSDTNTGIYRGAENVLRISTDGTERFEIGNTQAKITGNFITTGTLEVRGTGSSSFAGEVTLSSTTGRINIGSRYRLYADNSNATAWIGVGSNLNNLKIGDADFGTPWATFASGGNATFAGDVTLGGDTQLETAYTNLQLYMPGNATGLVLANGASSSDARNWGLYTNYSNWGALDFRVSSARDAVAHTTRVLSLKKDGTLYQATTFASGTNAYIAAFASNNAYEFIVNGDDRYYLFNAWQTSWSDRRLKKNITSITNGLDICDKLNPVTFNWKKEWAEGDAGLSNRKFYGIIAQELQEVLPELVYEGKDKLMVQRDELQWVLLSAVKELSAKVTALENA